MLPITNTVSTTRRADTSQEYRYLNISVLVVTNLCSILMTAYFLMGRSFTTELNLPYSPANEHIKYEYRYINEDANSHLFMGEPRPEYEAAWDEMLQGTYIRVSDDELSKANDATSIAHKDGGYVGGLAVGHNLHCLKSIRHYLHPEVYPLEAFRELEIRKHHVDHCLESLRQALLCNPDVSLNTLEWTPDQEEKLAVRWNQPNRCVNWNVLHAWLKERQTSGKDFVKPGGWGLGT